MIKLQPWQIRILEHMTKYKGKGAIQITGRNASAAHWTAQAIDRLTRDLLSRPLEDLVLSEGTVYGACYYCVEPIGGNWFNMEVWCTEIFGERYSNIWGEKKAPKPAQRWYANDRKFWFREEKDRTMFILKWR